MAQRGTVSLRCKETGETVELPSEDVDDGVELPNLPLLRRRVVAADALHSSALLAESEVDIDLQRRTYSFKRYA